MDRSSFVCALILCSYAPVLRGEEALANPEIEVRSQNTNITSDSKDLVPLPKSCTSPKDNPSNPDKVELGKMLFFDPRLSGDNKMSCASCHMPGEAYGDGKKLSPGMNGEPLTRNTQTCLNVGFLETFFWDGRAHSLEEQALMPIQSTVEMNQDLTELEAELSSISGYVARFQKVFASKPNRDDIAKSLAAFQRTLVTGRSVFDRYILGDRSALSKEAKQGFELFKGEAGCVDCHNGPTLSDGKFYRLGVSFKDEGRAKITGKAEDRYRFRTPTLRNVAQTGPYMHDGSLKTLDDVVTFYYRGIPDVGPDSIAPDTSALRGQSYSEIPLLVAFLKSLTGDPPNVKPPVLP